MRKYDETKSQLLTLSRGIDTAESEVLVYFNNFASINVPFRVIENALRDYKKELDAKCDSIERRF